MKIYLVLGMNWKFKQFFSFLLGSSYIGNKALQNFNFLYLTVVILILNLKFIIQDLVYDFCNHVPLCFSLNKLECRLNIEFQTPYNDFLYEIRSNFLPNDLYIIGIK